MSQILEELRTKKKINDLKNEIIAIKKIKSLEEKDKQQDIKIFSLTVVEKNNERDTSELHSAIKQNSIFVYGKDAEIDSEDNIEENELDEDDDYNTLDPQLLEFKKAIIEHKMKLKYDKENQQDSISILLSEIYRKTFSKNIECSCEKYIIDVQSYKKNLEKEKDLNTNLIIIKCLVIKMNEYFTEFKDKIITIPAYKCLRAKLKEITNVKGLKDPKRKAFWNDHGKKITGVFKDISIVYKTVIKASSDIEHIFNHSLKVIATEQNVKIKIENLQRERLKEIVFKNSFIDEVFKEILCCKIDEISEVVKQAIVIKDELDKTPGDYQKLDKLLQSIGSGFEKESPILITKNIVKTTNEFAGISSPSDDFLKKIASSLYQQQDGDFKKNLSVIENVKKQLMNSQGIPLSLSGLSGLSSSISTEMLNSATLVTNSTSTLNINLSSSQNDFQCSNMQNTTTSNCQNMSNQHANTNHDNHNTVTNPNTAINLCAEGGQSDANSKSKTLGKSVEELLEYIMSGSEVDSKGKKSKKKCKEKEKEKQLQQQQCQNHNFKLSCLDLSSVQENELSMSKSHSVNDTEKNTNSGKSTVKNKGVPDMYGDDKEFEQFKNKLRAGSIHAKSIKKIKPVFSKDWLKNIKNK